MPNDEVLTRIFREAKTIAVVGASIREHRAGHYIPRYLQKQGYRIIPVNPNYEEVLGEKCYPSLLDVPEPVDVVEVFRRPEFCEDVARDAVAIGAKVLWLQLGIVCDPADEIASAAGLIVVMDACMGPEHQRLLGAA
jgi:predicted CoA-binding protein